MVMDLHRSNGDNGGTDPTFPKREITSHDTLPSIFITNRGLLAWLRGLALQPHGRETRMESDQLLLSRTLHVRKCLFLDNIEHHPKKRKRELAWSDGEASTASGTTEKSGDSNFQKEGRKLKLHDPCSPQTGDVSNASNHKGMVVEDVPDKTVQDNSSSRQKFLELLSGENEGIKRPVIPVAPGFQAKIPDWIGSTKKGKFYGSPADSKTLRLLGIDVWPTYSLRKKTVKREVGKGRPNSCSCTSPGSTICITKHTREARELLRADLGSVFYTWKFDKMGEAISKSWTAREEHKFEHLVERNPLPGSKGFWGIVSKAFPTKSKKTLLSYYHNVFLIKRMRSLTKSSGDRIDSDDDHNDDFSAG